MDLVADIGNTRSHLAGFESGRIVAKAAVPHGADMALEWTHFVGPLGSPARIAVASVNPKVSEAFVTWARERFQVTPRVLGVDLRPKITVDVDEPAKVGMDRLVDALWVSRRFPGRAAVVIDCGTAITFNVVSRAGAFIGGAIAPGVGTQARALSEMTALLPRVSVTRNPSPIGRSTVAAIDGGIFYGVVGLVEALVARIESTLGEKLLVVATGGDAELVASGTKRIEHVVPDVTLEGVALALAEG